MAQRVVSLDECLIPICTVSRRFAVAVTKELIARLKLAAAVEQHTIKGFLLALAEERIQELEKNGSLPKGK